MPYLDNAATSWPKPESVTHAMVEFMKEAGANPGRSSHRMSNRAAQYVDDARSALARLFNSENPKQIVFTFNCTDALNLALKGLLKPGDHVVADAMSHNSLCRPLNKLARLGVAVTFVHPLPGLPVLEQAQLAKALRKETKLLAVTHGSNVTGVVQPVRDYGRLAGERGLALLVDAAQTAGTIAIDVQADNIDLLAFPGHKSLLGPMGTGGLYVGPRLELDSIREGGTGHKSEMDTQPNDMPYALESGTLNGVGIAGLGAGIRYIHETGMDSIRRREIDLAQRLRAGLREIPGITLHGDATECETAPVVSFNLSGWEEGELCILLDQVFDIQTRAGLHCSPSIHRAIGTYPRGTVRMSVGCFNTEGEIDHAVSSVASIAHSQGTFAAQ